MKNYNPSFPDTGCPICSYKISHNLSPLYKKWGYFIYKCPACSVLYVFPLPTVNKLKKIYDENYFNRGQKYGTNLSFVDSTNYLNDLKKIKLVNKFKKQGKILDVGCAKGFFLNTATKYGYIATGIEVSEYASDFARENFNLNVITGTIQEANFENNSFDIVTMWDTLEHISEPQKTIKELYRVLTPDGLLVFSTGDSASLWANICGKYWELLTPPQHLFFYNIKSLKCLLVKNGFEPILFKKYSKWVSLNFLLFKFFETINISISINKNICNALCLTNIIIPINLFDIITCVAVKR